MTTRDKIKKLSKKLNIDPYALHTQCAGQAVLFEEAGALASKLRAKSYQAKLNLEAVKAQSALTIRENPDAYSVKLTEASLGSLVLLDKKVKEAQVVWVNADRLYNECMTLQSAFEHRRSMLNNEVTLFNLNYWSVEDPSVEPRKHRQERIAKGRSKKDV